MSWIKEYGLEKYIEGETEYSGVYILKVGNKVHFSNMGEYGQLEHNSETILDLETGILTYINRYGEEEIINYKEK